VANAGRYVEGLVDPEAKALDLGDLMEDKWEEIVSIHKALKWALVIPRRLGGDATPQELAEDKKVLKKLIYLYSQLVERWSVQGIYLQRPDDQPSKANQTLGAQVRFPEWIDAQMQKVEKDKREMATAATQKGDRRSANKVVAALEQEFLTLARVRDHFWG
jgi:hypothetical protein